MGLGNSRSHRCTSSNHRGRIRLVSQTGARRSLVRKRGLADRRSMPDPTTEDLDSNNLYLEGVLEHQLAVENEATVDAVAGQDFRHPESIVGPHLVPGQGALRKP